MSSMNFSTSKQFVKPPERGIFPLDHDRECKDTMEKYLDCLKTSKDVHYKCRDFSREYLQCRMDHSLMSTENLDNLGYGSNQQVVGAQEYDKAKEKAGFVAGKHITKKEDWWFQKLWSNKKPSWKEDS